MPTLNQKKTGLWIVDMQEKLFPLIDRGCEILEKTCAVLQLANHLHLPLLITEQNPKKLGYTVAPIKKLLPKDHLYHSKTTFSGMKDATIKRVAKDTHVDTWILVGIEAHICVLQTAKDLLLDDKKVVILNDAVSSRSLYDFSTALGEMRDDGARISSFETVAYELIGDASSKNFPFLLSLIKSHTPSCPCIT